MTFCAAFPSHEPIFEPIDSFFLTVRTGAAGGEGLNDEAETPLFPGTVD